MEPPSVRKCIQDYDDTGARPFPVLQAFWQQLVLKTFVVLKARRNKKPDETRAWPSQQAPAVHRTSCQRVLDALLYQLKRQPDSPPHTAHIIAKFSSLLEYCEAPLDNLTGLAVPSRILFFDGGSRGNPGPGAAGGFIVDISTANPTPAILWSSATSLVHPTTTNNGAVYRGLIDGLQAAVENDWRGITVVGVSALILRQMRDSEHPRTNSFDFSTAKPDVSPTLFANATGVTMCEPTIPWQTDTRTAGQAYHPTCRPCLIDLPQLVDSDLHPWLLSHVHQRQRG